MTQVTPTSSIWWVTETWMPLTRWIGTHLTKMETMSATTSEEEAIQFVFPDVNNTFECSDRAIITGTNVRVDELNGKILARLDGPVMILHSVTHLDPQHHGRLEHVLTEEFLHSLKSPGLPEMRNIISWGTTSSPCVDTELPYLSRHTVT